VVNSDTHSVAFAKASACGNDFIIIEAKNYKGDIAELTKAICDRNNGVGADGVEWIYECSNADLRAHLINSDGSFAELSGNGTRCVAAWFCHEHRSDRAVIETGAGIKVCTLTSRSGPEYRFSTEMGKPTVEQPINLRLSTGEVRGVRVSIGNPHFVIFVDKFPQNWQLTATEIQARSDLFPNSTNVEFVQVIDDEKIEIRIFERGAGETLSSGTGSSATAAAAITVGRTKKTLTVVSPGGPQTVSWEADDLKLDGPARIICQGNYSL
jgi:diaminopimelate epimerase